MSKLEEYTTKAAASLTALAASTSERDRAYHRRAHMIWRRLIAGIAEADERAANAPPPPPVRAKAPAATRR